MIIKNLNQKPKPLNQFFVSKSTIHFKSKQKSQETKYRFDNRDLELVNDLLCSDSEYNEQFKRNHQELFMTRQLEHDTVRLNSNQTKKSEIKLVDYAIPFKENEAKFDRLKLRFSHSLSNQAKYFKSLKKIRRIENNRMRNKPNLKECRFNLKAQTQFISRNNPQQTDSMKQDFENAEESLCLLKQSVKDSRPINSKSYKSFMLRCTANVRRNTDKVLYS